MMRRSVYEAAEEEIHLRERIRVWQLIHDQ